MLPVRAGELPAGGVETVDEAGGRALLVGERCHVAAEALDGHLAALATAEAGGFAPARWAAALAPVLVDEHVLVLPASPDGRDLAPRLAHALGRPLLAGALAVQGGGARVGRRGGLLVQDLVVDGPFVATLVPGVRGVDPPRAPAAAVLRRQLRLSLDEGPGGSPAPVDARLVGVEAADPATIELQEADRIVCAGAGLDGPGAVDLLRRVGLALGAAYGATRVVTDAGWAPLDRQIGTTGVAVDPVLHLAFGVSGAVQHTAGLGTPDHVVSVNVDPSCPMMGLADLAVVADANATLVELADRLGVPRSGWPAGQGAAAPTEVAHRG